MNRTCATDDYVSRKLEESAAGIRIYKRIWRRYHPLRNDAKTLVLIFPEKDTVMEQYISESIADFLKFNHHRNYLLTVKEPAVSALSESDFCLGEEIVTDEEMRLLMQSFQFCNYPLFYQVAALDLPDGRRGSNILTYPGISVEDAVKDGIFSHSSVKDNKAAPSIYFKLQLTRILSLCKKYISFSISPDLLVKIYNHQYLKNGLKLYRELLAKYPEHQMCPAPYSGTGDVYVAAMILKEYAKRNGIEQYFVPVIGKSNVKICSLFGIEAVPFSKSEMRDLVKFLSFAGITESETFILHHDHPSIPTGFMDRMRNVKGIDFFSMYLSGVFRSNDRTMAAAPQFDRRAEVIDKLFTDHGLIKGKTILLAPYTYTLPKMNPAFWEQLAEELRKKGYTLCTNCSSKEEKPIRGTVPLFVPYSQIVPFLEEAGGVIAIRSGLCEVLSSARCRKVILYLDGFHWNGRDSRDYFSLNRMGLCSDAEEYSYQNRVEQMQLADTIAQTFPPVD